MHDVVQGGHAVGPVRIVGQDRPARGRAACRDGPVVGTDGAGAVAGLGQEGLGVERAALLRTREADLAGSKLSLDAVEPILVSTDLRGSGLRAGWRWPARSRTKEVAYRRSDLLHKPLSTIFANRMCSA